LLNPAGWQGRSQDREKRLLISSRAPSAWNNSAPAARNFVKFDIPVFFEQRSKKFKFHYNLRRITGTLLEEQYTFLIISRSILPRLRNVSDKSNTEIQNTHLIFKNFFSKNQAVCDIMLKNVVEPNR
jgi:hypothetical protein